MILLKVRLSNCFPWKPPLHVGEECVVEDDAKLDKARGLTALTAVGGKGVEEGVGGGVVDCCSPP